MDTLNSNPVHDWIATFGMRGHGSHSDHFDHRMALDAMTAGFAPMKAMALAQMELVTLASRRTQAYLGIPQRLAHCRTRQDLFEEQMRFWQTSVEQYQESTSRILQAWTDALGMPANGFGMGFGMGAPNPAPQSAPGLIQLPVGARKASADQTNRRNQRRDTI